MTDLCVDVLEIISQTSWRFLKSDPRQSVEGLVSLFNERYLYDEDLRKCIGLSRV